MAAVVTGVGKRFELDLLDLRGVSRTALAIGAPGDNRASEVEKVAVTGQHCKQHARLDSAYNTVPGMAKKRM